MASHASNSSQTVDGWCSSPQLDRRLTTSVSRPSHRNKISSADHVITIESNIPSRPSSSSLSIPASVPAAATDLEPWQSASSTVDTDLTTPLLLHAAAAAAAAAVASEEEADAAASTPSLDNDWTVKFPATAAARAAAAAARGLKQNQHAQQALAAAAAAATGSDWKESGLRRQLDFAYGLSWIVNIVLLVAKLYAYWISQSKAVLASAADSAVDLVSQVVIAYADWQMRREDPRFPVGQARLEAIGVLACACIMSVASFEVISESISVLYDTITTGELPALELSAVLYVVLGSATGLKVVCYVVCAALQGRSDSMVALAEDHLNDIMSNLVAIVTAGLAGFVQGGWWIDPAGAICISAYIVVRWLAIAKQQVDKIVGRGAPSDFIQQLEALAMGHHDQLGLDVIRAYHFGSRYIVEMEVVLPADMNVRDSHDISLDLQHKVEQFEQVERAFVHVDYMRRDGLEHKVERELAIARATSSGSGRNEGSQHASHDGAADEEAAAAAAPPAGSIAATHARLLGVDERC